MAFVSRIPALLMLFVVLAGCQDKKASPPASAKPADAPAAVANNVATTAPTVASIPPSPAKRRLARWMCSTQAGQTKSNHCANSTRGYVKTAMLVIQGRPPTWSRLPCSSRFELAQSTSCRPGNTWDGLAKVSKLPNFRDSGSHPLRSPSSGPNLSCRLRLIPSALLKII